MLPTSFSECLYFITQTAFSLATHLSLQITAAGQKEHLSIYFYLQECSLQKRNLCKPLLIQEHSQAVLISTRSSLLGLQTPTVHFWWGKNQRVFGSTAVISKALIFALCKVCAMYIPPYLECFYSRLACLRWGSILYISLPGFEPVVLLRDDQD